MTPKFRFPGTYLKAKHGDICSPGSPRVGAGRLPELFLPSSLAGEVLGSLSAPSQTLKWTNIEKDALCQLIVSTYSHTYTNSYTDHIHTKR